MKRRLRKNFIAADISFDDFIAIPEALGRSDRSVAEIALAAQVAALETKRRDRELKAAKQKKKRLKNR